MNYPQIAAAELLENQADRLYLYCWSVLRSRETAQIALRDTLLALLNEVTGLNEVTEPADASGSRLYSLARAECGRHRAVPAADADEAPVCLGRNDADNRLVAWNAAMSLEPAEFEALELGTRHQVDLGEVLGLPADQAQALLARARQNLERALGAEVLARRGHPCPDRAEVLAGWSGTMTPELRDRVLAHATGCEACTEARPRNVSAARVFSTMAAGTATGTVPQASGLGSAGPGPVASGNQAARLSRTQLPTPPPLMGTAGGRNQVLIMSATQPLPAQGAASQANAAGQPAGPATSATSSSPGTLQLSTGSVNVGGGPVTRPTRRPRPSPSASPTQPSASPTSASPTDTMAPDPSGS